jgi:hemerythrin superfamily protein
MKDIADYLREDHRRLQGLFRHCELTEDDEDKEALVRQIIRELTVHAAIEEELVYPVLSGQGVERVSEALEEHYLMKLLIGDLLKMTTVDEHFAAKVTVLAEVVTHHIREEESELLPQLRNDADLTREFVARKRELKRKIEEHSGERFTKSTRSLRDIEGERFSPSRDRSTGILRPSEQSYGSAHS